MTPRIIFIAAALLCGACASDKLLVFNHVENSRGQWIAGARVRAYQGRPTLHPRGEQFVAETHTAWNGQFLIETDPARTDFLLVDYRGSYAIVKAPFSKMGRIILRRP